MDIMVDAGVNHRKPSLPRWPQRRYNHLQACCMVTRQKRREIRKVTHHIESGLVWWVQRINVITAGCGAQLFPRDPPTVGHYVEFPRPPAFRPGGEVFVMFRNEKRHSHVRLPYIVLLNYLEGVCTSVNI